MALATSQLVGLTVKRVALDEGLRPVHHCYRRHHSDTRSAVQDLLRQAVTIVEDGPVRLRITGSGGTGLAKRLGLDFVQEVVAVRTAVRCLVPDADVVIELGGEDSKIVYLSGSVEERMNGSCAGGTGALCAPGGLHAVTAAEAFPARPSHESATTRAADTVA